MSQANSSNKYWLSAIILLGCCYLVGVSSWYSHHGLELRGDSAHFAEWSHNLLMDVPYHLPGYPLTIMLARVATLGHVNDVALMRSLNLAVWISSVLLVYSISRRSQVSPIETAAAYAFFPLVGLSFVAYPTVDILSQFCLLAAFNFAILRRWKSFAAVVAFGLLVHKGIWLPLLLLSLASHFAFLLPWWHIILSGIPLASYVVATSLQKNDWLWLIRHNINHELTSHSSLPILDGAIGTLFAGGQLAIVKGLILIVVFSLGIWMTLLMLKKKDWLLASLTIAIPIIGLFLNQYEAFALVRMSKTIVFPLAMCAASQNVLVFSLPIRFIGIVAVLLASNLAWSQYILLFYR